MKLVQVRPCNGSCCAQSPRWPNADHSDCIFHDNRGCKIMRGEAEIPDTCNVLSHLGGIDTFILTCLQWPQNTLPRKGKTGDCCWQWVDD